MARTPAGAASAPPPTPGATPPSRGARAPPPGGGAPSPARSQRPARRQSPIQSQCPTCPRRACVLSLLPSPLRWGGVGGGALIARAIWFAAPGRAEIRDEPLPMLGPGDLLVQA